MLSCFCCAAWTSSLYSVVSSKFRLHPKAELDIDESRQVIQLMHLLLETLPTLPLVSPYVALPQHGHFLRVCSGQMTVALPPFAQPSTDSRRRWNSPLLHKRARAERTCLPPLSPLRLMTLSVALPSSTPTWWDQHAFLTAESRHKEYVFPRGVVVSLTLLVVSVITTFV